jgi:hypothetical protein
VEKGPQGPSKARTKDEIIEQILSSHQNSSQELEGRESFQSAVIDDSALIDEFTPLNTHNVEAHRFIRANLDRFQFMVTDRVSITQFLSLFNVIGVGNAKKLDKLLDLIKRKVQKRKQGEALKANRN